MTLSVGPKTPNTVTTEFFPTTGDIYWDSGTLSDAETSDNQYAEVTLQTFARYSHFLRLRDFQFALPSNAIIKGFEVDVEQRLTTTNPATNYAEMYFIGLEDTDSPTYNRADDDLFTETESTLSYGSDSDLWGLTPTAEDVNDEVFSVYLVAYAPQGWCKAEIDTVTVTIHYELSQVPGAFAVTALPMTYSVEATKQAVPRVQAAASPPLANILTTQVDSVSKVFAIASSVTYDRSLYLFSVPPAAVVASSSTPGITRTIDLSPAATSLASPAAVPNVELLVTANPFAASLASGQSVAVVETVRLSNPAAVLAAPIGVAIDNEAIVTAFPRAVVSGGQVTSQASGQTEASRSTGVVASAAPAVSSPGLTSLVSPAAGVLGGQLHQVSIETNANPTPAAIAITRETTSLSSGAIVLEKPASTSLSSSPIVTLPGATIAARPAGEVLGGELHNASIETSALPVPARLVIGANPRTVAIGADVESQIATTSLSSSPIVTVPGAAIAARPAGEVLGGQLHNASIESNAQPNPGSVSISSMPQSLDVGASVPLQLSAASVSHVATTVSPGSHLVHVPAAAALISTNSTVSVETILKPSPASAQVGWNVTSAGLGHNLAIASGAMDASGQLTVTGGARVDLSTVGVVANGWTDVAIGVTTKPMPVGFSLTHAPPSSDISGAIQPSPAVASIDAPGSSMSSGAITTTVPGSVSLGVLPPAGLGAVHIADPDLFYTLPESRLHYTLYPAEGGMAKSKQTHSKLASTTKALAIDCAKDLADTETITSITSVTVSAPDDLTITGVAVNTAVIKEPGYPDAQIGQAIQLFVGGGTAGTTYEITANYATSGSQTLTAVVRLVVT